MRTIGSLALLACVLAHASACSKDEISADDPAGRSPITKDCPADLPGPPMVALPTPSGGTYCMDSTEVTQGQYLQFVRTVTGTTDPSGWMAPIAKLPAGVVSVPEQCKGNLRFAPYELVEVQCADKPYVFDEAGGHPDYPVGCVDWCDAHAYCAWAGKRLCGGFGGGSVALKATADPAEAQWMWACTQGGASEYSYGNAYDPGRCADRTHMAETDSPTSTARASDVPECRGAAAPFDGLYNLSANRGEWQDNCGDRGASGTSCAIHASVLVEPNDEAASTRCKAQIDLDVLLLNPDIGFRCCAD